LMDVWMSGELGGTLVERWMEDSLLFNALTTAPPRPRSIR
jgi:hypothetical protein